MSALGDGATRTSAVADAVRKHSRQPVLLIHDEHPLLESFLPPIAEEPHGCSEPLPDYLACALQASTPASPMQAQQLLAVRAPGVQAHVALGGAALLKDGQGQAGQADGQHALRAC